MGLSFNQLDSPVGLALTTLPVAELAMVVETLESEEPALPAKPISYENLRNYRELVARLKGFLQAENRDACLRCRLDTSRAVVSRYSRGREDEVRERATEPLADKLTQAVKSYLIARLNVDQAGATDGGISAEFQDYLNHTGNILVALREEAGLSHFLSTYLKELIRTYSGVWGVTRVHGHEVFGRIDELVEGVEERRQSWDWVMGLPPKSIYEGIAFAPSVDDMRRWIADLPR
jgi:hypothetical protein